MEAMEFIGRNTEEALRLAQEHFQLPLEELEVEVVSAGSSGILGLFGGKKAKVMVKPVGGTAKEAMDQVLKEFREGTGGDRTGEAKKEKKAQEAQEPSATAPQAPKAAAPAAPAPAVKAEQEKPAQASEKMQVPEEDAKGEEATQRPQRHAIADYSPDAAPAPAVAEKEKAQAVPAPAQSEGQAEAAERPQREERDDNRRENREPETPEVVEEARSVLAKLVGALDDEAQVTANGEGSSIELEVNGGEVGILIGRRGQTLDALQYLTTRIISHQEGRPVRVSVDAGGYRQRRREGLEDMARRMAQKARQSKKTVTVGPFNAQERRVVHLALKEMGGVTTASRGRGEMKKVLISPK